MALQNSPASLQSELWLLLHFWDVESQKFTFNVEIFDALMMPKGPPVPTDLTVGHAETLSQLDLAVFLFAATFCAANRRPAPVSLDFPMLLTESLASDFQWKWWRAALEAVQGRAAAAQRPFIQQGLEGVRLIFDSSMDLRTVFATANWLQKLAQELLRSPLIPEPVAKGYLQYSNVYWKYLLKGLQRMTPLQRTEGRHFKSALPTFTSQEVERISKEANAALQGAVNGGTGAEFDAGTVFSPNATFMTAHEVKKCLFQ